MNGLEGSEPYHCLDDLWQFGFWGYLTIAKLTYQTISNKWEN